MEIYYSSEFKPAFIEKLCLKSEQNLRGVIAKIAKSFRVKIDNLSGVIFPTFTPTIKRNFKL